MIKGFLPVRTGNDRNAGGFVSGIDHVMPHEVGAKKFDSAKYDHDQDGGDQRELNRGRTAILFQLHVGSYELLLAMSNRAQRVISVGN